MRRPGLEIRRRPAMVRARSEEYLSRISSTLPGPLVAGATVKLSMYPSRSRMRARFSFTLELGIFTVSCMAVLALRRRVSMSAMGSVIVIGACLPSPARLGDAGDLPGMDHHPQAYTAQAELAEHGLGPAAATATG